MLFIIVLNLVAPRALNKEKDTRVAAKPYNSYDLPKPEMGRGPEHVVKAGNEEYPLGYLARKIWYGLFIVIGKAHQILVCIAHVTLILSIENVGNIAARIYHLIVTYGPNPELAFRKSTAGLPKGSNTYGDGVSILGIRKGSYSTSKVRHRMYSTSALAVEGQKSFNGGDLLSKMKVQDGRYSGLYNLLATEELLFAAYHKIKSKPGNMTPGSDGETLDGISREDLLMMAVNLKTEQFKFKPSSRKFIPKANGKLRPLGIPCPKDKIVQMAANILLELIYEQEFLECSHGFRPGRGCNTAMAQINQ